MLASTELPLRTDRPLRAAIWRKSPSPFFSPRSLSRLQYHSPAFASTPSLPFHLASSRSAHCLGSSCFFTALVLYACTNTLMNCGAQPRCAGTVPSSISLCRLEATSCSTFSRYSASSSGEDTPTASNSQRLALFSAVRRCSTLAEDARQASTRTP